MERFLAWIVLVSILVFLPQLSWADESENYDESSGKNTSEEAEKPDYFNFTMIELANRFGPFKYLYGNVNDQGEDARDYVGNAFITIEHFQEWKLGTFFFFLDLDSNYYGNEFTFDAYSEDDQTSSFFNHERLALYSEMFGNFGIFRIIDAIQGNPHKPRGIIEDVFLSLQANIGSTSFLNSPIDFLPVVLAGVDVSWNLGNGLLTTALLYRHEFRFFPTFQVSIIWDYPIQTGPITWIARGFLDFWPRFKHTSDDFGEDAWVMLTQAQFFMSFSFINLPGLLLGVELQLSHDFPSRTQYVSVYENTNTWDFAVAPMIAVRF